VENGLRLHVSCGENVLDFMRNCTMAEDELEVLEQMVNFSHYCPTAPFSLRTEPYMEDHLVMEEMPHVMVAGKAKSFACRMLRLEDREVLLVAVPAGGMGLVSLEGMQARSFN
jgi:DNA polymerase II small subunit/DNA polymerase delta subunit B